MSDLENSNRVRDEVAAILQGLSLDKSFFSQKLSSDSAHKLVPRNPDGTEQEGQRGSARLSIGGNKAPAVGTGFRRRPSMVARRFPDFDVYLSESLMPVLAQALDALGRQVSRMKLQGDKLDARVRARFNPITWLAQQLLRRHPRVASTPRRMALYRNFHDWADQERGRRELLRSKPKFLEVFNGFMQNGIVGRNSLTRILEAVDDLFHLKGALKDSQMVQQEVLKGGPSRATHRRGSLGGDAVSFDQFWFKMANVIVKHDGILLSTIQEGRRLQKLREEEQVRALEAARREERRQKEAKAIRKLNNAFSALYPKLSQDEALQSILDGKTLTGEFLKPTDPEYASQVAPHGPHVLLLAELMNLLGLETRSEKENLGGLEAEDDGRRLFRNKVQHQTDEEVEKAEAEKEEKAAKDKRQKAGKRQGKGSKEEPREASPTKKGSKEDPGLAKRGSKEDVAKRGSKEDAGLLKRGSKEDVSAKRGSKEDPGLVKRGSTKEDVAAKRGSKESAAPGSKRGSKEDTGSKPGSKQASKEEPPEEMPATDDRWWDSTLKSSWKILQAAYSAERTGIVEAEVLRKLLAVPDDISLTKHKVTAELQKVAENGVQDVHEVLEKKKQKPTMEELSLKYGMSHPRLMFFHDLFESFLPVKEDGSPGTCGYPENPSVIDRKTMFSLLKQLQPTLTEAEFEARFKRLDHDASGVIEFDEFVRWVYDDEVEVVGSAEKVKRTFEELADDMDVDLKLIMYVYDCFKFELGSQVDEYPKTCAAIPKEQACALAGILVKNLTKKKFERYWEMIDVDQKAAVTFDDFCELLDFEDMPEEILAKYNSED